MSGILYLTFDSVQEGVGASQALAYVKKLSEEFDIELISFEKEFPKKDLIDSISRTGIIWKPLEFGNYGILGGLNRIYRLWKLIDRKKIIHARGNLSALSAMLRFPKNWIWDSRALHSDQRRAISGSSHFEYHTMRVIEFLLAKFSSSIIVITKAVVPVLVSRHRIDPGKLHVISTCVDTELFEFREIKNGPVINILLQGTFSNAYDIELMNKIIKKLRELKKVDVTVCTSKGSTNLWKKIDYDHIMSADYVDMYKVIAKNHVGMSLWRENLGICLKSVASTKVAEFLAVGRPVIVNQSQGDLSEIIGGNRVGVVTSGISDEEVDRYAHSLLELLEENAIEQRCRKVAIEEFSLNKAIADLRKIYLQLSH